MARGPDGPMFKWSYVQMVRWPEDQMVRCPNVQMARGPNWSDVLMIRCLDGQISGWSDIQMVRCLDDQMSRWSDVWMVRCPDGLMSKWSDVWMVRCLDSQKTRWSDGPNGQQSKQPDIQMSLCLLKFIKQILKYWCSLGNPCYPSNDPPEYIDMSLLYILLLILYVLTWRKREKIFKNQFAFSILL